MRARNLAIAALICALLPVAARAQPAQAPPPETSVEGVVVRPEAGPAWWRVRSGDSVVWLLSVPRAIPADLAWNRTVMEQRVAGAREVFMAPRWRIREGQVAALLKARNVPGMASEDLPAEVARARDAAALGAGLDPKRYRAAPSPIAGLRLSDNAVRHWKFSGSGVRDQLTATARRAKIPIRPVTLFSIADVPKDAPLPSPGEATACVAENAAFVSAGPEALRAEAQAWAVGDYRRAFELGRPLQACMRSVPGVAELLARIGTEHLATVESALQQPGYAVALATPAALADPNGLVATLKAKGYEVLGPDERGDARLNPLTPPGG